MSALTILRVRGPYGISFLSSLRSLAMVRFRSVRSPTTFSSVDSSMGYDMCGRIKGVWLGLVGFLGVCEIEAVLK